MRVGQLAGIIVMDMERRFYLLDPKTKTTHPCRDTSKWQEWMRENVATRIVADSKLRGQSGPVYVTTMFLGLDQRENEKAEQLLFETRVINSRLDGMTRLCSTWVQAECQHEEVLDLLLREGLVKIQTSVKLRLKKT